MRGNLLFVNENRKRICVRPKRSRALAQHGPLGQWNCLVPALLCSPLGLEFAFEFLEAADIAKKADPGVQALSAEQLKKFLETLEDSKQSEYYPIALAQFCLGLRIGEACGLHWEAIDLPNRVIRIEWTIEWVKAGGRTLGKPTHFEARDGRF